MAKVKFNIFTGNLDIVSDSSGDLSFNGNRPVTLPGIPGLTGQTLGGSTIKEFLEGYFPAVPPGAMLSIAANQTRLFGASNAVTLNWTATKNTNPITAIEVNGQSITPTGNTQSGSQATTSVQNVDTSFSMTVTAGAQNTNASASVLWRHHRFWFKSNQDLLALSDADLSTFLIVLPSGTFEFAISKDMPARNFSPANEYLYFAYLASYGPATYIVNGLVNNAFIEHNFLFTNVNGYAAGFKLYRSNNLLTGTYTIDQN